MNNQWKVKLILIISFIIIICLFITNEYWNSGSSFLLEEATITSIHESIKQHKITCEQLTHLYINRIQKYNLSTNKQISINAIARINLNVIEQARELDRYYEGGKMKGSLHCIPVLLKDNIDSYDSPSSSGSLSLLGNQATQDAFLTKKLRDAGAIIFGKSTMDEFSAGMVGISGENGRTGNVYNTKKNAGGSSGGSAVAVSANFTMIGIGTDNCGSIRVPAAFNGIVGLRPSTGLISQRGIFPRGNLDSVAGPLTRTVEDLAIVLDVIAKPDLLDKKTLGISRPKSYSVYLDENALKNKRIGIVNRVDERDLFSEILPSTRIVFQNSVTKIQSIGATIVPNIKLTKFTLDSKYNQSGEREDVNAYLASYPAVRKDYYAICESERTRVFGTSLECLRLVKSFSRKYGPQYYEALSIRKKNKDYVESVMNQYHLDALLIPVSALGSIIASNAGLPSITLNFGYEGSDQMPIGAELIGKQFSEGVIIGMAYAYEKNTPHRRLPVMPEANNILDALDISQYNNLLTNIGYNTYQKILINRSSGEIDKKLLPEKFQVIVDNTINRARNNE